MSETAAQTIRFKTFFIWGGIILAVLGLVFVLTGYWGMGLLLMVAGVISFLFAKRRSRARENL